MKKLLITLLALTTLTIFSKAQTIYSYVSVLDSMSNPEVGYTVNINYSTDNWATVINKIGITDANGIFFDTIPGLIPPNGGIIAYSIFDCNNQLKADTFFVAPTFMPTFQPVFISCSKAGGPVTNPKSNAVYISGSLIDVNNNPVANQQVNYIYQNNSVISYPGSVTTDAFGYFYDSIPVKPTFGFVAFNTADCNGGTLTDTVLVDSLFPMAFTNLIYCDTATSGPCNPQFFPFNTGNLSVDFYATQQSGVVFQWDFGDGITANSTQPMITHTYANPGTYQVCLTVTGNSPVIICTATQCLNVTVINGNINSVISGSVYTGNNLADDATVYLIEYDSTAGGILTAIDTVQTAQGMYQFVNAPSGWYIIKAALNPNSFLYHDYLPTYHQIGITPGPVFWHQASPVFNGVIVPGIQYDVHMVQGVNLGGPGFIGGSVLQGANKTSGGGIANVLVILLDNTDHVLTYTYTDVEGNFAFDDLPIGDYKIYTEVAGLNTIPVNVSLTSANPTVLDVVVKIEKTGIVGSVGIQTAKETAINLVYPNPFTNEVNVFFDEKYSGKTAIIEITDLQGKNIFSNTVAIQNNVNLSLENLPSGMYFLRVNAEDFQSNFKITKK